MEKEGNDSGRRDFGRIICALPNEMTPTAWKKPSLTNKSPLKSPLLSAGTLAPCDMTVMMIMHMLINASVDAFDNYTPPDQRRS